VIADEIASQAHRFKSEGGLEVIATNPTILHTHRMPDGRKVRNTSSLLSIESTDGSASLLLLDSCLNDSRKRKRGATQCVDPAFVDTPDGGLRMFYVSTPEQGDPAFSIVPNTFRSAILNDQGRWEEEPGERMTAMAGADPDVIRRADGSWRMYYTKGLVPIPDSDRKAPGIVSAISTDGLSFEPEAGVRVPKCSASASMILASGQVRLYCHTRDIFGNDDITASPLAYIVSYISDDGVHFEREPGARLGHEPSQLERYLGSAAPSIRPHPDGGISMVFTTVLEPPYPWNEWYLDKNEAIFERMERDLKGRADMGRPKP
jgi:hypothetical protein